MGQAHYLSGILENYDTLIGQFINERKMVTYQDVMNVISYHYRSYFTKNFHRNLNFKIQPLNESELSRSEHQLLKYITKENIDVGFQNRLLGNRTLLIGIATSIVEKEKLLLTFHSDNNYEFDEYDVEAIRSLIKYGDILLQHLYFTLGFKESND